MVERGYYSAPLPVTALKTPFRKVGIEPTFFPGWGKCLTAWQFTVKYFAVSVLWYNLTVSNRRHSGCKPDTLPTELRLYILFTISVTQQLPRGGCENDCLENMRIELICYPVCRTGVHPMQTHSPYWWEVSESNRAIWFFRPAHRPRMPTSHIKIVYLLVKVIGWPQAKLCRSFIPIYSLSSPRPRP